MLTFLVMAQVAIVAHAPARVNVCEPLEVTVAVSAPAPGVPQLLAPAFGVLDEIHGPAAPEIQAPRGPGRVTIYEYKYVLVASEPGAVTIAPFVARVNGSEVRSAPLTVLVVPRNDADEPTVLVDARLRASGASARTVSGPDTVYVGQQATYAVTAYLDATVRDRLQHNPTFYPPEMPGMLAYDWPVGGTMPPRPGAARCFEALTYRRAVFPLRTGRLVIPPAHLTYTLPVSASFFSRSESHDVPTDSAVLIAVDPPAAGRPADFDGAVGRFQLALHINSSMGRVGDPFVLTLSVSGTGNVKLLPAPHLALDWATVVKSEERVSVDSTRADVQGRKDFDWILTPRSSGAHTIPVLQYQYFDPSTRRYRVASSEPAVVQIAAGVLAASDTANMPPPLPIRMRYAGARSAPLSSHPAFWVLLALMPLPAIRSRWRNARRRRRAAHAGPIERLSALTGEVDPRRIRHAYVAALAERLGIDAEALTTPGGVRTAARRAGASEETAERAEALLRDLDANVFGAEPLRTPLAAPQTLALLRQLDKEALPRSELPYRRALLAVLLLVSAGATLRAIQVAKPEEYFAAAVSAYQSRHFAAAQLGFSTVVAVEPNSADGWANVGTSAWATGDTVNAAFGWRRALSLDPLSSELRARLSMIPGAGSAPGQPFPVTPNALLLVMALCWAAAWALWEPRIGRTVPRLARCALPLVVMACAAGVAAIGVQDRLSGEDLGVVRVSAPLRADPALGADQGPDVSAGAVVRVLHQSGAWDRVLVSGGRQGWIPDANVARLDGPVPTPFN